MKSEVFPKLPQITLPNIIKLGRACSSDVYSVLRTRAEIIFMTAYAIHVNRCHKILAPHPHFTGKIGPPLWTWGPPPVIHFRSTGPPAHVNACHSLSVKRVKGAKVHISVSWRRQRRFEYSNMFAYVNDGKCPRSSQRTRNTLYESESNHLLNLNGDVVNAFSWVTFWIISPTKTKRFCYVGEVTQNCKQSETNGPK